MTLKVVNMPSRSTERVVEVLEKLLKDAKDGKIRNICYAAEYNTFIRTNTTGTADAFATLGHIERMKQIIHREMDTEEASE